MKFRCRPGSAARGGSRILDRISQRDKEDRPWQRLLLISLLSASSAGGTVFGLPGDGINGLFEALRTHQDQLRFIQARHEEAAAFAACGYAKYTGRLGVCLATSGPGGIHLLNGLYDAKLDGQPVLALTGHTFHDLIGTHHRKMWTSISSSWMWSPTTSASWARATPPMPSMKQSRPPSPDGRSPI
jgi:hypothetical protein